VEYKTKMVACLSLPALTLDLSSVLPCPVIGRNSKKTCPRGKEDTKRKKKKNPGHNPQKKKYIGGMAKKQYAMGTGAKTRSTA